MSRRLAAMGGVEHAVVPEEGMFYAAGRDVTERHRAAQEQAALRRVAILVASEPAPEVLFATVGREVGELLGVDATHLGRYDPDGTVVSVAQWGRYPGVPIGARYPLDGDSASARVLRTGRPARIDSYEELPGVIAETVRQTAIRFSIGVPITVEGKPWGVMIASSQGPEPFPADVESRLEGFTDLVATAISNASAHDKVRILADEQAALLRVATLVAQGVPEEELSKTLVEEVGKVFGVDAVGLGRLDEGMTMSPLAMWTVDGRPPTVPDRVPIEAGGLSWDIVHTDRPSRMDDWSEVDTETVGVIRDQMGVRSSVGAPIRLRGEPWGVIGVHSKTHVLPPDTEARLERFAALVATALTNAQARAEVRRLADEQAALR